MWCMRRILRRGDVWNIGRSIGNCCSLHGERRLLGRADSCWDTRECGRHELIKSFLVRLLIVVSLDCPTWSCMESIGNSAVALVSLVDFVRFSVTLCCLIGASGGFLHAWNGVEIFRDRGSF